MSTPVMLTQSAATTQSQPPSRPRPPGHKHPGHEGNHSADATLNETEIDAPALQSKGLLFTTHLYLLSEEGNLFFSHVEIENR